MSGAEVLVVMRDHTGISGVSGGKLCLCGVASFTAAEHTAHVADAIAEAFRAAARERKARRAASGGGNKRVLSVAELDMAHLGEQVTVAVLGAGDVTGLLLRADAGNDPLPGFLEVELLPPGDAPPRTYLCRFDDLVEVGAR